MLTVSGPTQHNSKSRNLSLKIALNPKSRIYTKSWVVIEGIERFRSVIEYLMPEVSQLLN